MKGENACGNHSFFALYELLRVPWSRGPVVLLLWSCGPVVLIWGFEA